jgi:hypothetical protein
MNGPLRFLLGVGLLGLAAYKLAMLATGSTSGAVAVAFTLGAWLVAYLAWRRFRRPRQ